MAQRALVFTKAAFAGFSETLSETYINKKRHIVLVIKYI